HREIFVLFINRFEVIIFTARPHPGIQFCDHASRHIWFPECFTTGRGDWTTITSNVPIGDRNQAS
ncbi:MAG: hypothetical protein ACLPQ0_17255, partial [Candidatus Binatus sp.]